MTARFNLAANVKLTRRLKNLLRLDENTELDRSYISCAEYQLFIDQMRARGEEHQPDHWREDRFPPGNAQKPITGVRASDAKVFCQWLTDKYATLGFRYRLPTVVEVKSHPLEEMHVGCWCTDVEQLVVAGIDSAQWQSWQGRLVTLISSAVKEDGSRALKNNHSRYITLAYALEKVRAHNKALDDARNFNRRRYRIAPSVRAYYSAYTRKLELDRTHDRALAQAIEDALVHAIQSTLEYAHNHSNPSNQTLNRFIDRALAREGDRDLNGVIDRAVDRALNKSLNYDLLDNHNCDPDLTHIFDRTRILNHARTLDRALESAFDILLAQNLTSQQNRSIDLKGLRTNLLLHWLLWVCLSDFYGWVAPTQFAVNVLKFSPQKREGIIRDCHKVRDEAFQIYAYFVLIEERRAGRIPAWEGIRIVRERME